MLNTRCPSKLMSITGRAGYSFICKHGLKVVPARDLGCRSGDNLCLVVISATISLLIVALIVFDVFLVTTLCGRSKNWCPWSIFRSSLLLLLVRTAHTSIANDSIFVYIEQYICMDMLRFCIIITDMMLPNILHPELFIYWYLSRT